MIKSSQFQLKFEKNEQISSGAIRDPVFIRL